MSGSIFEFIKTFCIESAVFGAGHLAHSVVENGETVSWCFLLLGGVFGLGIILVEKSIAHK